jgi:hypothetical protein
VNGTNVMAFSEDEIRRAGQAIALGEDQLDALLAGLQARSAGTAPEAPRPPAYAQIRFDLVHLLWYAGALIVIGAMGLFSTLAFDQMGGKALATTALVYAVLFVLAGHHLWHRRHLRTPGGLLVAVAVAMMPLAVYGIQDAMGWWGPGGDPGRYNGFFVWVKGSWLPMEIVTVLAGLVALRFYPFAFIAAIVAVALWFMSMDLTPWLMDGPLTWAGRRKVSMIFGLAVLAAAWAVDVKRSQKEDVAFWLHLCGLAAFWGGLTLSESSSEIAKAIYCLINVALVFLSVFLMRRAYALFGAIGIAVYLGHLANEVFKNSLLFPFALSLIGILVIAAGLVLYRHRGSLSAWMSKTLPSPLKKLRPPHADATFRLEHA